MLAVAQEHSLVSKALGGGHSSNRLFLLEAPLTPPTTGGHGATVGSTSNTHVAGGVSGASVIQYPASQMDAEGDGRGSPSLDSYGTSSNKPRQKWDKKQKRGYHRVQSCLQFWQTQGYQVLWVMLSTADGGDASKLAYHHQILRQRVERKLAYDGLQHYQVRTSEGNGVLHLFWAWCARDGFRQRSFYIEQDWLSKQWQDIHGAKIVWIARVKRGRVSRNKVSRYCMAQYVGQQSGYQYMSWSWGRMFGFPLVACWRWLKRRAGCDRSVLLRWWARFLSGGFLVGVPGVGVAVDMGIIRQKYREWGSELWQY